jgi:hypothetical protein
MRVDRQLRTHHFVVTATVYEDGSVGWFVDDDTLVSRFSEGVIWDEKTNEWMSNPSTEVKEQDEALATSLSETFVNTRNQLIKNFEEF